MTERNRIEYLEQQLSIAIEVGDRAGQGRAYNNLGNAYYCLSQFRQAIEYHKQCLSIAIEVGDRAKQDVPIAISAFLISSLANSNKQWSTTRNT